MTSKVVKTIIILISVAVASCSHTSITESWKQPDFNKTYEHLMIIGVSDSQQTRRIYEDYFADSLKQRNLAATPSYKLISSKDEINRDTVARVITNTDIDAVLVTYLVAADSKTRTHDSPLNPGYSGSPDENLISSTLIATRGRSSNEEIIGLKNDLYDVTSESLVWSAQTKTVAPESIDHAITEVTELLIKQLVADNLLK